MNKLVVVVIKVFVAIGAMAILDEALAKSYKDGFKRGIEIGEHGNEKTVYTTTNVED